MTLTFNHLLQLIIVTTTSKIQTVSRESYSKYDFNNLETSLRYISDLFSAIEENVDRIVITKSTVFSTTYSSPLDINKDDYIVVFNDSNNSNDSSLVKVYINGKEFVLTRKDDRIKSPLLDLIIILISMESQNTDILRSDFNLKKRYFDDNMFGDKSDERDDDIANREIHFIISKLLANLLILPLELFNPMAFSKKYIGLEGIQQQQQNFSFIEKGSMSFLKDNISILMNDGDDDYCNGIDEITDEEELEDKTTINSHAFKEIINGIVDEYRAFVEPSSLNRVNSDNITKQNDDRIETMNEWWNSQEFVYVTEEASSTKKKTVEKKKEVIKESVHLEEIDDLNNLIQYWKRDHQMHK